MRISADHHTHTPLCKHATGPMEGYVERAIELGLKRIGFADHNPLPNGLGLEVRMAEAELDKYVSKVQELQFRYRGKIEVLLGMEMDYVQGLESYLKAQTSRYPFDYIIGSIHYLESDGSIISWPRDFDGDTGWLYGRYFELMQRLIDSELCDIIAHFDVPKRSGRVPTSRESAMISRTLEAIADAGLCMEINTSGYRHPELDSPQPYPALPIVEEALSMNIPVAVNSDAHDPQDVGAEFERMEQFLGRFDNVKLVTFEGRKQQPNDQ